MKKALKIFFLLGVLCSAVSLQAQNMGDMRLNEILVTNTDDFEDDFGHKNGWIELFNTSYGTVDIAGCYLTDDPGNLKKYMIPKGDILTKIKPRQHILFWADNQPFRGTFHINFDLANADEILFVSSDGRTVIDRIKVPADMPENISYGRTDDGIGAHDGSAEGWQTMERTSPSTNNTDMYGESKAARLEKADPHGALMAFTAMSVVFLALILLYLIFKNVGNYSIRKSKQRESRATGTPVSSKGSAAGSSSHEPSAEVYAAIAMAMHLYREDSETHDIENTILTIHKVSKSYSPWSSKIYTLRETPQLKRK